MNANERVKSVVIGLLSSENRKKMWLPYNFYVTINIL